ncbi:helix-turn-helix transcriptional regulator [Streptomyces sp. NPDC056785]|uniref:helix-turn-helix transcriptional regulator n=1 Tax=Streptomyces sp. NPDC056785 TaxID=3345944 RepID=UPI00368C1147
MHELPDNDDWLRSRQRQIGERVQAARLRRSITQEALYLAAGVDRRTIQTLEAGTGNPTVATLLRVAHVLNVPVTDFIR